MLAQGRIELEMLRSEQSVQVSFPTEPGKLYRILTSTDIDSGEWIVSGDPIEGTGGVYPFHLDYEHPDKTFFKVEELGGVTVPGFLEFTPTGSNLAMAPIPAGRFTMGSPDNEDGRERDEGPRMTVTIGRPFWMSRYEVTQRQYEELMGNNPSRYKDAGPTAPVERVSWNDAVEYCRRLTERERAAGPLSDDLEYRLPTEAQWEYACRAGTTTRFSHGDDPGNPELNKYAWSGTDPDTIIANGYKTHPVGEKLPNPWGLYDMSGNVWEWCRDFYIDRYPGGHLTDPGEALTNSVGPASYPEHVARGGSGISFPGFCRSASRQDTNFRSWRNGFRLVLVSVPVEPEPTEALRFTLEMAPIPAGTFRMGSTNPEEGPWLSHSDEGPPITVTISQPFEMSKYEVTQGQYEEVMGNNPSNLKKVGPKAPVETVRWKEPVEFCRRLTARERAAGDLRIDSEYRLPTEAQWEYACRAGTTTATFQRPH